MNEEHTSDDLTQEVALVAVKNASEIPFELFGKKNNKTTQLLNPDAIDRTMKGKHEWYNIFLEEPVFVTEVEIFAEGYSHKSCMVSWKSLRKSENQGETVRFEDGRFSFSVNDFISAFGFKPDQKLFWATGTKITRIVARGFTISEFEDALVQVSNLEAAKQKVVRATDKKIRDGHEALSIVEAARAEEKDLEARRAKLAQEIAAQRDENDRLAGSRDTMVKRIESLKNQQSVLETRIEAQNSTIEEQNIKRSQLLNDVSESSKQLKELENNIYLFPSEIKQFAEKAGKDKAFYWKLAAVPIAVLAIMAFALLKNAADLTTIYDEQDNARLISIFMTRLPYVAIAGAIIGVMFKLASQLVSEIMRIDSQTRSLAKISIIATDVSAASVDKLDLSPEEIYHLRTGLKMDLLREHLKTYISEDFEYLQTDRVASRLKQISANHDFSSEVDDHDQIEDETPRPEEEEKQS
jgi:hypothetical protein